MDTMNLVESLTRWIHVVAGILWIGLLYFFNWVNSAVVPTLDAESKKKVLPELLPRTLFWFRWGAAYTWISGALLLGMVFYMNKAVWADPTDYSYGAFPIIAIVLTFLGVYIYDILYKTVLKNADVGFVVMLLLSTGALYFFSMFAKFGTRGTMIHLGATFGSAMAFNVWYRIWPAQQKIIRAIKNGEAPDGKLAALAGSRSKHNTSMSVPLVFAMLNTHMIWATEPWHMSVVILVGWLVVRMLYAKAKTVPGF
jgi:uncharacterized membrane protein